MRVGEFGLRLPTKPIEPAIGALYEFSVPPLIVAMADQIIE